MINKISPFFLKVATFIILLSLMLSMSVDAMTWEEYKKRKNEREIKFYIAGVGTGYYYTNNYLTTIGRPKLYCQPADMNIPGEFYQDILITYGTELGEKAKGVSVEILLLSALLRGALNSLHSCGCILNMLLLKVPFYYVRPSLTAPEMFSYR